MYIENFQSIKEIEFLYENTGVYYYKGDNNIGKSSIIKAMNTLIFNASNHIYRSFIRDDEESFFISMTDFEGNVVELSRGKVDFYRWVINGEEGSLDRTNGQVPEEVSNYFNMYVDDKTKECVNIRLPRAVLLGVDTSASDNNYMLQKALDSEVFTLAYKNTDRELNALKKEVKLDLDKQEELSERIMSIDVSEDKKEIDVLEKYIGTIGYEVGVLQEIEDFRELILEIGTLQKRKKTVEEALSYADSLEENYTLLELLTTHESNGRNLEGLKESKSKTEELVKYLEVNVEELEEEIVLLGLLKESFTVSKNIEGIKTRLEDINKVLELDLETEFNKLKELEELIALGLEVGRLRKELRKTKEEIATTEDELKECENELGMCPLCKQEFRGEGLGNNKTHSH